MKKIITHPSFGSSFDTFLKTKTLPTSPRLHRTCRTSEKNKIKTNKEKEHSPIFFFPLILHVLRSLGEVGGVFVSKTYRRVKTNGLKCILVFLTTLIPFMTYTTPSFETGMTYQKNENFTDAITCYEEILVHESDNADAWFNLGLCYLALGQGKKALDAFNIISHVLPAQYNAAYTYKTIGDLNEAIQRYKTIIHDHPDYDPAHLALGITYLTQGDFENGWKQHERYLKKSGKNADALRTLIHNKTLAHKHILLRPEGGLGDTLLFIRYAQRLKNMGAHITLACQKPLIPLLSRCAYIDQLLPQDSQMPSYDADATLMSLPAIFADDDTTAPKNIPYLYADPELIQYWHKRLAHDKNFKIGICWQVDVHNDESRLPIARRGCPLAEFSTLSTIAGITFYSLQKYDGIEELATMPANFKLQSFNDLDDEVGPFMDTAALMKNLDLIITVDTAIVHLAGALGCPVLLLHPYATADWRWICHRTDSYWYPTVRIFKQQNPFDWKNVMKDVKTAIIEMLNA